MKAMCTTTKSKWVLTARFVALSSLSVFGLDACCPRGQHRTVTGGATVTVGPSGRPTGGTANIQFGCTRGAAQGAADACLITANRTAIANSEVIKVPADYQPGWGSTLAILRRVGQMIEGASGACAPACDPPFGDPDSDACLRCRQDVAVPNMTPFLSYCLGSAFASPPNAICAILRAETDVGAFESSPILARKRDGTVRYDDCGSANRSDFDFDQGPIQNFASYIENQGARNLFAASWREATGCAGGPKEYEPLVQLTEFARALILAGQFDELDDDATHISTSVWPFQAGGGDPYIGYGEPDGAVLVSTSLTGEQLVDLVNGADVVLTGQPNVQLKPCNTDLDCALWPPLRCLPTSQWGSVCKDPSAP